MGKKIHIHLQSKEDGGPTETLAGFRATPPIRRSNGETGARRNLQEPLKTNSKKEDAAEFQGAGAIGPWKAKQNKGWYVYTKFSNAEHGSHMVLAGKSPEISRAAGR